MGVWGKTWNRAVVFGAGVTTASRICPTAATPSCPVAASEIT